MYWKAVQICTTATRHINLLRLHLRSVSTPEDKGSGSGNSVKRSSAVDYCERNQRPLVVACSLVSQSADCTNFTGFALSILSGCVSLSQYANRIIKP